ncbi:hypothetical protein ACA910_014610 [Epithemia clementina (nom. ined.)]
MSSNNVGGAKYPQQSQREQRINRSGHNSYLKIVVDETTLAYLRQSTLDLQNANEKETKRFRDAAPTAAALMNHSSRGGIRPRQPLLIQPRSLDSLHLTFFFGGEVLCNMSADDLTLWHSRIEKQFAEKGFGMRKGTRKAQEEDEDQFATSESVDSWNDKYWLRIREFRLFPPRRNNVVVALLDASPSWHTLYDDIRQIAKSSTCQDLVKVVNFSKEAWVPHITLANIKGQTLADDVARLNSLLNEMNIALNENEERSRVQPSHIAMGGPIPATVGLDWNFYPIYN